MAGGELGQRPHGDVDALERLDAPDEEQHRVVAEGQGVQGLAGTALVAGEKNA